MRCDYHDRGLCDSCTLIDQPYAQQLRAKQDGVRALLHDGGVDLSGLTWLEPVASAESGFRNKAKMVVAGTVQRPTLGILDPRGRGIDLRECPLYPEPIGQALPILAARASAAAAATGAGSSTDAERTAAWESTETLDAPTGVLPVVVDPHEDVTSSRISWSLTLPALVMAAATLALGVGAQGLAVVVDVAAQGLVDPTAYVEAVLNP